MLHEVLPADLNPSRPSHDVLCNMIQIVKQITAEQAQRLLKEQVQQRLQTSAPHTQLTFYIIFQDIMIVKAALQSSTQSEHTVTD